MVQFVPLCTCASEGVSERELRLRGAGIELLESDRLVSRRVALVGVLHVEDDAATASDEFTGERGVYVSTHVENASEQDASALTLILRGVDLQKEPFWGSLLVLLSSHLFVAHSGPVTSTSFNTLAFLSHLMQVQVLDNGADDAKPEHNTLLLRDLVPRFTWAAIDLKQKDLDGSESPSKYFEQRLTSPSKHGFDVDAQMLMLALLHTRDCIVLKANSLQPPDGFATPHAVTSSKLLAHALDGLQPKPFFGRYVNGSLLLHLLRSLAAAISSPHGSPVVLQRVVNNVYLNFWKTLVNAAFVKYTDVLHARLGVYEKVPFDAEYLLDITERKLQTQQVAVVNAGQGKFSAFDEFGNLKRQASTDLHDGTAGGGATGSSASPTGSTLNTGIFTFLKERAERAFTKQFSLFENTSMTAAKRGGASNLAHVPEADGDDDDDDIGASASRLTNPRAAVQLLTPDDVLARCNAPIKAYSIPMAYLKVASESMPVDTMLLERLHREALDEAKAVIVPFLYGLRCTSVKLSEFVCTLNFSLGKHNLLRRIAQVKRRFERANEAASALFCAELIRCLHAIVLSKNERDKESQTRTPTMRRNTLSVMHLTGENGKDAGPPLTKLPVDLLTYKNNLEALVSQYNFVARGPLAAKVMIAFFQSTVRNRLLQIAQKEYERFDHVCDSKRDKLEELEEVLEAKQRSVKQVESVNAELSMQEALVITEIEREFQREAATIERAIREANDKVESALVDQQALYQSTMQATRKTINTMDQVVVKNRLHLGYLKRFEKGHLFSKSWRQYFYALDNATLRCYASKSAYEERKPPIETPIILTGYNVIKSRTDEMKIKLIPPEAGQMLRFRAPVSVGRETWMKRFMEAAQLSESSR